MVNLLFIDGLELDFFNPRSLVVFICILQGAVFATLLLARFFKTKNKSDFWLAALLFVFCLSLITPLIGFANVYDRNQWLTYFPFHIAYSYGVCIWFYVLNLTDSRREFRRGDLLFFVPSGVFLIFRFALFAQNLEFKAWFDENYYPKIFAPLIFVTEFVWNVALLYLSIRHYKKYRRWLDENFSDTEKIKFDWLKNFLYVFTSLLIVGAAFDFTNNFVADLSYIQYFYFELVLALVTYYLALAGYLRSQNIEIVFTEKQVEEIERIERIERTGQTETIERDEPPRRNFATENEIEKLKNKLEILMTTEKPFLEPALTLSDLAKILGVNSAVLSRAINLGFGKNFNDFVNEFRIDEVKKKLAGEDAKNLTLLGVAFECGFNSKATFNRAFKKFTGVSPKEYQTDPASG